MKVTLILHGPIDLPIDSPYCAEQSCRAVSSEGQLNQGCLCPKAASDSGEQPRSAEVESARCTSKAVKCNFKLATWR